MRSTGFVNYCSIEDFEWQLSLMIQDSFRGLISVYHLGARKIVEVEWKVVAQDFVEIDLVEKIDSKRCFEKVERKV